MKKKINVGILAMITIIALCSCSGQENLKYGKTWSGESIEHENFTDLGNYVIELPEYKDESILEKGLAIANSRYDNGDINKIACTAMAKTNDKGEVVIGRNMDVEVSQYPAFVHKSTYGKYDTVGITYTASSVATYEEIKQMDSLPEDYLALVPFIATDVFNEKGLYVEINMRTNYSYMSNYGLHSTHGETTRDDGTPWSELRLCNMCLPQVVCQNCATIEDVLSFVQNSYDWYTLSIPYNPNYDGWNMCFVIGDATGKYGVLEIAQDEISWLPYQHGQANFYLTPRWAVLDTMGTGYGRFDMVNQVIDDVQTLDDAMNAMKKVMWRNELLWVGQTYRADSSTNPNPYNQIIFCDDEGNSQMDWRCEYSKVFPVLDDGRLILSSYTYESAKLSSYDPSILKYIEDAVKAGTLVVDDGSILFNVNDKKVTLDELYEKYNAYFVALYEEAEEDEKNLEPYFKVYEHLLCNDNTSWCLNDYNFEAIKAAVYAKLHIRYDDDGNYDSNSLSTYEKLLAFYGYGVEKNETYIRDQGNIWTTGLNIGVNCAKKQLKVRFWENDEVVYNVTW